MVILDEETKPILIDSINTPLKTSHFWALNLENRDFQLSPLEVIEEHTTPILVISVYGYAIELPSDWNILIMSSETNQLDVVEVSELSRGHFNLLGYVHDTDKIVTVPVKVIHWEPKGVFITPSIAKNQMVCHAVGERVWVCVSPVDTYNKYLKGAIANDLVH